MSQRRCIFSSASSWQVLDPPAAQAGPRSGRSGGRFPWSPGVRPGGAASSRSRLRFFSRRRCCQRLPNVAEGGSQSEHTFVSFLFCSEIHLASNFEIDKKFIRFYNSERTIRNVNTEFLEKKTRHPNEMYRNQRASQRIFKKQMFESC